MHIYRDMADGSKAEKETEMKTYKINHTYFNGLTMTSDATVDGQTVRVRGTYAMGPLMFFDETNRCWADRWEWTF